MKSTKTSDIIDAFLNGWICNYGVPQHIMTDQGRQFESSLFTQLSKNLGFVRLRTTSYHPQSNGKIERFHRKLKTSLIAAGPDWLKKLPTVLWSSRMLPVSNSTFSPFTLLTGENMNIPTLIPNINNESELIDKLYNFINIDENNKNIEIKNNFTTPKCLQKTDLVLIRNDRIKKPLEAPYAGPYKILKRFKSTFEIELPSGPKMVSISRLKPFHIKINYISLRPVPKIRA
jgi:hypothetical protein